MSDADWDPEASAYERKTDRLDKLIDFLKSVSMVRLDPEKPLSGPLAKDRDHAVSGVLDAISRLASES